MTKKWAYKEMKKRLMFAPISVVVDLGHVEQDDL